MSSHTENTMPTPEKTTPPLVWIDLEMSGLDPEDCRILEAAVVITDGDLNELGDPLELIVHQPDPILDAMDSWNTNQHGKSGLTEAVKASKTSEADAEEQIREFVLATCKKGQSPLCGNTVGHDKRFLIKYMPTVDEALHYRIVDVSSIKEMMNRWYPDAPRPKKGEAHRALDDIRESIAELRFYREKIFRAPEDVPGS
jgi:oligoribonuclease